MAEDAAQANQALSSTIETLSCSLDQPATEQTCIKPETSQQSLQIDCRANNSQPDIYHSFPSEPQHSDKEQSSPQDRNAGKAAAQDYGRLPERYSRDSREENIQDPTSSHESSRPESLAPSMGQTHDKVFFQLPKGRPPACKWPKFQHSVWCTVSQLIYTAEGAAYQLRLVSLPSSFHHERLLCCALLMKPVRNHFLSGHEAPATLKIKGKTGCSRDTLN